MAKEYMDLAYNEYAETMLEYLPKGALLVAKNEDKINPMTIGWGSIGFIWGKPIFTVLVRHSRYTYEFMEGTDNFVVSVPLSKNHSESLKICGTKSGREIDKIKECGFDLLPGRIVNTPVIGDYELHYECKIVYKQDMNLDDMDKELKGKKYPLNDRHTIYYGEIVDTYLLKDGEV